MYTMKKLFRYFLLLVGAYLMITLLINLGTGRGKEKTVNYIIETNSPIIEIYKFESSHNNKKIEGSIRNDTDKLIKECYLKVEFYNKDGFYKGTEYKDIKYLNINETMKFSMEYKHRAIESARISIVDNKKEEPKNKIEFNEDYKILWFIIGIPLFCYYAPTIWFGL